MLPYLVVIPLLISVFMFVFSFARFGRAVAVIAQTFFTGFAFYIFMLARQETIYDVIGGFDSVLGIILRVDNVSSALILLTTVIFLAVSIYSFDVKQSKLYWLLMFIWQGMIIGVFLTRDLFNIFVLMEVSTVVISVLFMYNRHSRSMYDGVIYIMVNIVAMQFYLFGLAYLYMITGALDINVITVRIQELEASQLVLPYALIMTGMAFKCALLPIFSWIPKVRAIPRAPSPVAAIISGLHVKCIIFVIIQINDIFYMLDISIYFIIIGIITAIGGIIMSLGQKDIKLILAYSSIAQVGLIIIGLNLGGSYAFIGSVYHMVNHALFKVALFLGSGMIIEIYGTRDISKISGIFKLNPLFAIINLLAIAAIMGTPIFNGFISKYFIMSDLGGPLFWIISIINLGTLTVFIRYATMMFGKPTVNIKNQKMPSAKVLSVSVLGVLCLVLGLFSANSIQALFNVPVDISFAGYIEKVVIFAISFVAAIFLYKYIFNKNILIKKIGALDCSFKSICFSLGCFFGIILLFVGI